MHSTLDYKILEKHKYERKPSKLFVYFNEYKDPIY